MRKTAGFTLIELVIAIAMLCTMASIALPKVNGAIRRSQEARTLGNLAMLRSSIALYLTNTGGVYPTLLEDLTAQPGAVLDRLPLKWTPPYHPEGNTAARGGEVDMTDSHGDWFYFNHPNESLWGTVIVNCIHPTLRGKSWSSY